MISDDVKLTKLNPVIFRLLLKKIHFPPEECILIDDSMQNTESAHRLGFSTHHFKSPARLEMDLVQLAIL
jgi:HAD superfamily hydrolase (TIGR01509 family)